MQLRSLLVALGAGALAVRAQSDFAAINNVTSLAGTWSSGSFPVSTGLVSAAGGMAARLGQGLGASGTSPEA